MALTTMMTTVLATTLTGVPGATSYSIDAEASAVTSTSSVVTALVGTLIGDHDPETNPGGTQTRPGVFGGSGNQAIPMTADIIADGGFDTVPSGGLLIDADPKAGTIAIDAFTADLLGGAAATLPITIAVGYDTFHTVSPDALYLGGFTVPIPLGSIEVTALALAQSAPSIGGTLTANGDGGYDVLATLPAVLTFDALFQGQPIGPLDLPIVLPITGTLDDSAFAVSFAVESMESVPGPGGDLLQDVPFDLPTILPPGDTAHLLITAAMESITNDIALDATIVATPDASVPGDVDGNGVVDFSDILAVLADWGACPGCAADLDGTDVVDFNDLLIVLANWSA